MKASLRMAVVLVGTFGTACGHDVDLGTLADENELGVETAAPAPEEETLGEVEAEVVTPDISLQVSWRYLDFIGRSIEQDVQVAGAISLTFLGPALPLAGETATLRPARLTMSLPSFEDPKNRVLRQFLVHLQSNDGGKTLTLEGGHFNRGSVVDLSLSNAAALFAGTYDAATQTARPRFFLSKGLSSVRIRLTEQVDGSVKPTAVISAPRTLRNDFAYHSVSIQLE